ncbi:hypothetical protein H0H81_003199 [Sphagnurus paluster]|uniref:Glycine--tRNA ligase n=1 Tax=Sphagnurus paluster TaxID=117069 RepID=A0A9P7FRM8_9AGAR|nr:hypothetical protein H0H81_003199 [Sphagnurus paluster]
MVVYLDWPMLIVVAHNIGPLTLAGGSDKGARHTPKRAQRICADRAGRSGTSLNDKLGTRFGITLDFASVLNRTTMTLRERDTTDQRIGLIDEVIAAVTDLGAGQYRLGAGV